MIMAECLTRNGFKSPLTPPFDNAQGVFFQRGEMSASGKFPL
jgi:hypothetical protein